MAQLMVRIAGSSGSRAGLVLQQGEPDGGVNRIHARSRVAASMIRLAATRADGLAVYCRIFSAASFRTVPSRGRIGRLRRRDQFGLACRLVWHVLRWARACRNLVRYKPGVLVCLRQRDGTRQGLFRAGLSTTRRGTRTSSARRTRQGPRPTGVQPGVEASNRASTDILSH